MKKVILMMITAAMLCGTMTACSSNKVEESTPDKPAATTEATEEAATTEEATEEETTTEAETEADTEAETDAETENASEDATDESDAQGSENPENSDATNAPAASGDTLGNTLRADFEAKAADGMLSTQILADQLMENPVIAFSPATMPVEAGMLMGFGEAEITGFKEGTMFSPMIGSIPFIGYIFELEEGTDGEAFMQTLKDNADPRWNICVEAEEMVVNQVGNKVFFVMCPTSMEG